jgi:uncharacterized membrane protein
MTAEPSDNTTPALSEPSRIVDVYLDPKKAFADIAARPTWWTPLILLIVVSIAFIYSYGAHVGWERGMRQIDENNTRIQQMDQQTRERTLEMQVKYAPIFGYGAVIVGIPVYALAIAGALLLMVKMMGASPTYKQMFAITAYGMLPGVIAGILQIVVVFLKNPEDFNLQNPLAFNLGAFMSPPPNSAKFIYSLATSLDLFTIWNILLMATGIWVATRKFTFSKALTAVLTPWVIWILVKSAWAGIFG